ncbi:hypothetical protein HPP92_002042 [Vanilla planifolia]|uniref:Uncharacterized protein n=1 Tax=Vanilla planifolia TaxID=51239 RepID=A0A835VLZ5_VANPL|nr:hypothetical protein HPP92_002042 [Vanilla planifolia]
MRGIGGPLLCIGDLLSDIGEDHSSDGGSRLSPPFSAATASSSDAISPIVLPQIFQENYDFLIDSLAGTDHSWTASTLMLCAALEKADKLVAYTNSHADLLLEKIELLDGILKRGDAAVTKAMEFL